jgi:hypothetical protein
MAAAPAGIETATRSPSLQTRSQLPGVSKCSASSQVTDRLPMWSAQLSVISVAAGGPNVQTPVARGPGRAVHRSGPALSSPPN